MNFLALEQFIKSNRGSYCVGDQVTVADIVLVPQVATAARNGVDISKWPNIAEIYERLCKIPEFEKAAPANQPDAE